MQTKLLILKHDLLHFCSKSILAHGLVTVESILTKNMQSELPSGCVSLLKDPVGKLSVSAFNVNFCGSVKASLSVYGT